MKWITYITKYLPEAPSARRAKEEGWKGAIRKHIDDGKTAYHSSWISSEYGLADFRKALDIQDKLYGEDDHPAKIETMVWIAKALHKQNDNSGSMKKLQLAFRMQLQHTGMYQSATVAILDSMITVVSSTGTPQALSQAQTYSTTLRRIKYRLYGKVDSFSNMESSSPSTEGSTGCDNSILMEMEGDHLLSQNKDRAVSKYRDAALAEYQECGSRSLSLALLHRKVAIASINSKSASTMDDPFEVMMKPTCGTKACKEIRKADSMLFENHEQAAGHYMLAKAFADGSHPRLVEGFHVEWLLILMLIVLGQTSIARGLKKWIRSATESSKENKSSSLTKGTAGMSGLPVVTNTEEEEASKVDQQEDRLEIESTGSSQVLSPLMEKQSSSESMPENESAITDSLNKQVDDDDHIFATSFESLGASFMDREIERVKAGHLDSAILDQNAE